MSDAEPTLPGKPQSYWLASSHDTDYPQLTEDLETDVVIIGGGIVGLTTAYLLQESGKNVIVLEAGRIVAGVTGNTTAKITSLHTLIYDHLISQVGEEKAQYYGEAQQTGLEFIAELVKKYNIDCDFTRAPAYTYTQTDQGLDSIKKEVEAAQKLGRPASFTTETELPFPIKGAIKFDNQAHFHPRNYLLFLAKKFIENGGQIFENSRVVDFDEGEPCTVKTDQATVTTRDIVMACHYPILHHGAFFTRLTPYRTYALGLYVEEETPKGMYISDDNLYSIRPQSTDKGEMLVITGGMHKTGQNSDTRQCYADLEQQTRKHFTVTSVDYRWSTQDPQTPDKIPYIGQATPFTDHLYVASGFDGWGMTNGTAAALLLTSLIQGVDHPWQELFNPSRGEQVKSAGKFLKENLNVGKELLKGKLTHHPEFDSLKPAEAKIVKIDGQEVAAYRDRDGQLHTVSATCTHMGCTVSFNTAEESWDCPCHGSRFSTAGEVLHGPAVYALDVIIPE